MAHYAFLNNENVVVDVIVGRDEDDLADGVTSWESYYGNVRSLRCLRTSYNTHGGQHISGGEQFRGNYAGIGYIYDEALDAFIPPQPFPSWVLDEDTFSWEAPTTYPSDGEAYRWDESAGAWVEVEDDTL
jgi:hypothetical protein